MSKKSRKSNSPSIDEKRILVERALKSSFVNIGAISDEFYGLSQGHFDASLPSSELCDPDSILYVVDDICGELSAKGEIVELLNVLTVLYAVKKEIPLRFDSFGSLKVCGETGDETFDMLYNATVATRGPEYNFCDVWKLYRNVAKLNRGKFLACYPNFIDAVKNRCTALKDGTVALPKPFIAKTIGDIVKAHGCKSVFNPFSGVGGLMLGLDRDVVYVGQEAYGLYSIFARVLADAYGMSNTEFRTVSPVKNWPKEAYDAVIFNLPTDCFFADFEKYILKCEYYNERHKRVFELLMKNHTAKKLAVGLVRFPFISNYEFKELRHQLLDNELIESVICLPEEGVFADSKIKTAIVVLDFENKHSTVDFFRGEYAVVNSHSAYDSIKSEGFNIIDRTPDCFRATVGKDVLEYFDWRLVSAIYANPVHCADDENSVSIMELASIIPIKRPKAKSPNVVSYKCFSTLFYDVLCKRNEYVDQEISECNRAKVSGPCVLFCVDGESGKIAACIIREGETVVYDTFNVYALRPYEDKVSLEYLAYKLVTSKDFNHYLTDCIEYYADDRVSSKVLLNASLPVNPDLGAQKRFVEEKLKKYVLTRDRTYNVIWASELWKTSDDYRTKSRQDKIISDVSSFGIRIISTPFTATQLSDELRKYVDDCSSTTEKADAVIVDADITYGLRDEEEYDGLDYAIELKDRYEGIKLPFYLFTDKTFEELSKARIKARRLEYFRDRYFCASTQDAVESLCLRLQDEMDVLGSWVAEMRSKYVSVFQAADRYDDGDIQRVLADALGEEFSNELSLKDTQDKFNKLRQLAEGLLDGLAKAGIVPALNFGAQVDFLVDGRFDDYKVTGLFYHLDKNIMPDALGVALRYFKQIVAAGSHQSYGENHCDVVGYVSKVARNSDLYKSVLYIFMDLLLWYDWAMDKAENDPEFLDGMFRSVPRDDEEPGVVSIDEYDGQLVCKHTRLNTNESSSVGVGDLVKIRRRKVDKWHPTQEIWFVADPEDYYVVASDE